MPTIRPIRRIVPSESSDRGVVDTALTALNTLCTAGADPYGAAAKAIDAAIDAARGLDAAVAESAIAQAIAAVRNAMCPR